MSRPDPIPISAIEHYEYCARQSALILIDGVWADNQATFRGEQGHQRADSGERRMERDRLVIRSVPLWSTALNLTGRADVVEIEGDGSIVPVEYKMGTRHGRTADLQLCAEALCLEEMTGRAVGRGAIWYGGTKRRHPAIRQAAGRGHARRHLRHRGTSGLSAAPRAGGRCSLPELPAPRSLPARRRGQSSAIRQLHGGPLRCGGGSVRERSVLYVNDYRASVGVNKRNLNVRMRGRPMRIPIHGLEAVVLFGGQMTTEAMDLCVRSGVRVAALRKSGRIRFVLGGPTSGNVLLRVAQVEAAGDAARATMIARSTVAAKLGSYRSLLRRWAQDAEGLRRRQLRADHEILAARIAALEGARDGDTIRGIEGEGTRRYFRALCGTLGDLGPVGSFPARTRRPPRDPVNALLSLLYGLALVEVVGAAEAVGLDPQVGFLHGLRPGRASLGLDLLEELRPLTDRLAVRLFRRRQLRMEHFALAGSGACFLTEDGRKIVLDAYEEEKDRLLTHHLLGRQIEVWRLPVLQATLMARHLRGDLPSYPAFVLR